MAQALLPMRKGGVMRMRPPFGYSAPPPSPTVKALHTTVMGSIIVLAGAVMTFIGVLLWKVNPTLCVCAIALPFLGYIVGRMLKL